LFATQAECRCNCVQRRQLLRLTKFHARDSWVRQRSAFWIDRQYIMPERTVWLRTAVNDLQIDNIVATPIERPIPFVMINELRGAFFRKAAPAETFDHDTLNFGILLGVDPCKCNAIWSLDDVRRYAHTMNGVDCPPIWIR
jgi:hypothetical protein